MPNEKPFAFRVEGVIDNNQLGVFNTLVQTVAALRANEFYGEP